MTNDMGSTKGVARTGLGKTHYTHLLPIRQWHTNANLKGFGDVMDLPVTRYTAAGTERVQCSVWKMSLWQRIKFLFSRGKLFIHVTHVKTHPPIALGFGEFFTK